MHARLQTLGRFDFLIGDVPLGPLPTQKARALLVYLALNYRLETPRERLIELFWSEMEPARAREGLRTTLSTIRRALRDAGTDADAAIVADRTFVRLNLPVESDVEQIDTCAQSDAESDWRSAVDLYGGDFLDGNYEEWTVARREHYATLFEDILARLVRKTSDVKAARLLLTRNPYDEHAYATLLESELQAQRMTAARELFARYRAAMNEAAIEPSPELLARYARLDEPAQAEVGLPFVARHSELARIERGIATLVGGRRYVATIVGEPGIGKTALIKRAEDVAAHASCNSFVVRAAEESGAGAVWGSLYHRVTGTSPEKLAATAADIPALIASAIANRLPRPAILFVDDAHALRGDALATLVELARLARDAAFGLVVAMRPEGLAGAALILAPYVDERMELGPLGRDEVDAALTLALTNSTPQLNAALFARSGGHPLFLISLLESLVRNKTLDRDRGRWRVTRELGEQLELPQDLRGSIDARLRAAGDDASVVACALSLEPSATADDLAAALGYDESIVLDALDRLLGFALIREDAGGCRFHFPHDIVREVAATLLNAGRRVALHREFARLYERDRSSEGRPKTARHLQAAGMMAQAAHAYLQAARDAIDTYAFHDALQFCGDGADCVDHLPASRDIALLRARLKVLVTEAALQTGAFDLASSAADDAARAARATGEPEAIATALVSRTALQGIFGDARQRLADAREALQLSIERTNLVLASRSGVQIAASARAAGKFDDSAAAAAEARARAGRAHERALEYHAAEELLRTHISWWRFADAEQELLRARSVAEAAGVAAQARLCCISAWFHCLIERFDAANLALVEAEFLTNQIAKRRDGVAPDPACPLMLVRFTVHFLEGIAALAEERCNDALAAAGRCLAVTPLASLAPYRDAAVRLELSTRIKAGEEFREELIGPTESLPSSLLFTIDSAAVWRACVTARKPADNARAALRAGLDDLEERANLMPLDCDRGFALLARAAHDAAEPMVAARAKARRDHYYAARMAAAALHRATRPRVSSGSMSRPSV